MLNGDVILSALASSSSEVFGCFVCKRRGVIKCSSGCTNWKRTEQTQKPWRKEPTAALSLVLLLSNSLYNANILWKISAKKLLAFHPTTTNPQAPTPRPHALILSQGTASSCFQTVGSAGGFPFLFQRESQPSPTPLCKQFVKFICWTHLCLPIPPPN